MHWALRKSDFRRAYALWGSLHPAGTAMSRLSVAPEPEWLRLHREGSEPPGYFFSDNVVSNESSLLQAADELLRIPKGLAYLGVGPEQNLTYLALVEPRLAFIVDARRDNARLHFLYRAIFEEAADRSEFLLLLLGRQRTMDVQAGAPIGALLDWVERCPRPEAAFANAHARAIGRLERLGLPLGFWDRVRLRALHRRFFERQMAVSFELVPPNGKTYPPLRQLLQSETADGRQLGFLASETAYRKVRALEMEGRVVPMVGDLAGPHTLRRIATELRRKSLVLGTAYLSNVEQYLFEEGIWPSWFENLKRIPRHPEAIVLRTHLDQGRAHPRQWPGHRFTTIAQRLEHEISRGSLPRSYWELVTETERSAENTGENGPKGAVRCG